MNITTLENTTLEEITEAFNASFSDYFFPVKFTKDQFEDKFSSEGGRLDLSIGVYDGDTLVAFILNFIKIDAGEKINYNGGTGVIPNYRGKHFTSKMYDFMLPVFKENKVDKMVLEVLTQNTSAIKIYKSQGFKVCREVGFYKGKINRMPQESFKELYQIVNLNNLDWNKLTSFWDHAPTWQSSSTTMDCLFEQNVHLGIMMDTHLLGYLIYNPKIKRIHQIAIDKKHRNKGLGSLLINTLSEIEQEAITVLNVDLKLENTIHFFEKRGLVHCFNQYEMEMKL